MRIAQTAIARDCETLRNETLSLLVGTSDLEQLSSVRVASFGNSDPSLPGDWVPVVVTDAPVLGESETEVSPRICPNIVLSSHVEIVHAAVGSSSNPQVVGKLDQNHVAHTKPCGSFLFHSKRSLASTSGLGRPRTWWRAASAKRAPSP